MVWLWIRARMSWPALELLVLGLSTAALTSSLAMPILRVGLGKAPFSVLIPVMPALGILALTPSPLPLEESQSHRRGLFAARIVWPLLWLCVCTAVLVPCAQILDDQQVLASLRNVVGYLGIALIVRMLAGPLMAYAAPAGYAVAVAILGSQAGGLWAWPIREAGNRPSWLISITVALLGVVGAARSKSLVRQDRRDRGFETIT